MLPIILSTLVGRDQAVRIAAIYFPLALAALGALLSRRRKRQFAAVLLSFLWTFCTLLALQRLNQHFAWWTFITPGPALRQMPVELYLTWAIFWGIVPQLLFPRLQLWRILLFAAAFDFYLMPACRPLVSLGRHWLIGELLALAFVLFPALLLNRWTLQNTHLNLRATLQVALSGLLFLFLVPEVTFALRPGAGWQPLLHMPSWQRQLALQLLCLLALPGVSAVQEFAQRGRGTPIPYDPPQRLVTSGLYRYTANPMQLSCTLVMLLWALMLRNPWLLLAAGVTLAYSAGLAEWDEAEDLRTRFPAWPAYRAAVHAWRLRWRPFHAGPPARLYIAETCGPCSELRTWLEARHPLGLTFIAAESLPAGSIRRLRYDPADGTPTVDGIRALARALEHLTLPWALTGAALRLPVLWQLTQLLTDASGLGPRFLGREPARL